MKKIKFLLKATALIILCFYLSSCSGGSNDDPNPNPDPDPDPVIENIESKPSISGIRLDWDFSSQTKISNGIYSRVIQLKDNSLMAVYETAGNIAVRKSTDMGTNWSSETIIFNKINGINMATPDILQLNDDSILVCYNPRPPQSNTDTSKKYAIKTIKSYDGGATWTDDRLLYEAGHTFEDGCWEPSALQLPSGEVQLYFSNEGIYTTSNEQNISLFRSLDNGLTWTTSPQPISFRIGKRDGMPSPILLKNGVDIVFSIEDNFVQKFKPFTIRSTVSENWASIVDGFSNKRDYALLETLDNAIYAGAPYLRQLSTGETILSYQGTENRNGNDLSNSVMKVTIGDDKAYDFTKKTEPFNIPLNASGLWNSIAVTNNDTVIAVTSTSAFSPTSSSEVWMTKGYVIPEIEATNSTITVDGNTNESVWNDNFPIFIGHKGLTNMTSNVFYDNNNLYLISKVKDVNVTDNDGITIYIDTKNRSLVAPGKNIYKIFLSANNNIVFYEGNNKVWNIINETSGISLNAKNITSGYQIETAIPWSLLGEKPALNTRIGFTVELSEKGNADYKDIISNTDANMSYTWSTLKLK
ncbi:sugar-binding protein [Flavivirga sp. 57AJ16]|uniref:sugar-binding protein n=1 Tax=Flavivirga sp. 57AJ16 TaxID=3025307 RepID=UPI0023666EA9|nr:sugar-binding protein [Flavivirga sp. 57AJ16]MDD7886279.1 sugar-binding protein [Flavivirga sp. 57AJ16]